MIALKTRLYRRLPTSLQKRVRLVRIATMRGSMPLRARLCLLRVAPRMEWRRSRDVPVRLPGGVAYLGAGSLYVDAMTLGYTWGEQVFPAECRGRVVLDLGAHKGYFGAWALAAGAAHVHSVEPQSGNFERLVKTQRQHRRAGSWSTERAAVGSGTGEVQLFVSAESWAHSVQDGMIDAVAVETVRQVPLSEVLEGVARTHPDVPVVVKINVEGSAGNILLPASADDLARVVEVHLDHEPGSPYRLDDVLSHLKGAGLSNVTQVRTKIFVIRRSGQSVRPDLVA